MLYKIENKKANEDNILCRFFLFSLQFFIHVRHHYGKPKKKKKKENSTKRFTLPIVSIRRFYTRTIFLIYRRWVATEPAPSLFLSS